MACLVQGHFAFIDVNQKIQLNVTQVGACSLTCKSRVAVGFQDLALQAGLLAQLAQAGRPRILGWVYLTGRYSPDLRQERFACTALSRRNAPS